MEQSLVSIVIPVYNLAPYLKECLDTVVRQSYKELQVLLVNDGSTDSPLDLCRIYTKDSRFRLIDKENTGVSDSRNRALDLAQGKYIQFIDGDDWLTEDATETLVHAAETTGADLVLSHFYRVSDGRKARRGHIKTEGVMTRRDFAEQMMKAPANYYAHHLRFDTQVNWCEDFLFNLEYIEYARLIATVPKPTYYYRKREGSLVNGSISLRRTVTTKKQTFAYYKDLYQKLDLYEDQKAAVYSYFLSAATDGAVSPLAPKLSPEGSDPLA